MKQLSKELVVLKKDYYVITVRYNLLMSDYKKIEEEFAVNVAAYDKAKEEKEKVEQEALLVNQAYQNTKNIIDSNLKVINQLEQISKTFPIEESQSTTSNSEKLDTFNVAWANQFTLAEQAENNILIAIDSYQAALDQFNESNSQAENSPTSAVKNPYSKEKFESDFKEYDIWYQESLASYNKNKDLFILSDGLEAKYDEINKAMKSTFETTAEDSEITMEELERVSGIPNTTFKKNQANPFFIFTHEEIDTILKDFSGNEELVQNTLNEILPDDAKTLENNLEDINEKIDSFNKDIEVIKSIDPDFAIERINLNDSKNSISRSYGQLSNYLNVELNLESEDPDSFANVFMDLVTRNAGVYNRAVAKANQLSDEDFLYFYGDGMEDYGIRGHDDFTENDKIYQTVMDSTKSFYNTDSSPFSSVFRPKSLESFELSYVGIEEIGTLDIDIEKAIEKDVLIPELPIWPIDVVEPLPVDNVNIVFTQVKSPRKPEEPLIGDAMSSIEEGVAPIEGEKIDPIDYTLEEPIDVTDVSDPTEFNEIEWIVSEELEAPIEAKKPELVPSVEKIKSPNEVSEKPKDIVKPKEIVFPDELEFPDLDIKNPNVVTKPNETTSLELIELPVKPGKAGAIQKVNEPEKPKDKINPVKPVDPTNPGEETEPKENITVNNSQKSNEQKVNLELEKNQLQTAQALPKTGEVASVITSVSGLLSVLGGFWIFRKRK